MPPQPPDTSLGDEGRCTQRPPPLRLWGQLRAPPTGLHVAADLKGGFSAPPPHAFLHSWRLRHGYRDALGFQHCRQRQEAGGSAPFRRGSGLGSPASQPGRAAGSAPLLPSPRGRLLRRPVSPLRPRAPERPVVTRLEREGSAGRSGETSIFSPALAEDMVTTPIRSDPALPSPWERVPAGL